jgi:hypothetical protein
MSEDEEKKYISRYARPIEFVSGSNRQIEESHKKLKTSHSSGNEVAALYRSITSSSIESHKKEKDNNDTLYCEYCQLDIAKNDYKRHTQSIGHMVASDTQPPPPDILTLNGRNIGFKMLQSQGWQYKDGLGATNQGRRHPISTALKPDRLGIGHSETSKRAVTHKYKEIEKKAIQRYLASVEHKDPGKEISKKAKDESNERVTLLNYLKN